VVIYERAGRPQSDITDELVHRVQIRDTIADLDALEGCEEMLFL
jgi:hypothetical protein